MKNGLLASTYSSMKLIHMCAAYANHQGMQLLIKYGADINEVSPGSKCWTVLSILSLARVPTDEIIACLDLVFQNNVTNIDYIAGDVGKTYLITAAMQRRRIIVNRLLREGADPTIEEEGTRATAIWYTMASNNPKGTHSAVLPFLYANFPESMMWPVSARCLRALPTSRPLTPQMIAVYRRDMASIKAFVEAGWFIHQAFYKDRHFYAISREAAPSNPADDELLAEMVTTVPKLQWWAKRSIRQSLPLYPHKVVDTLPIPKVLKQYVLEVDELATQDEEALQRFHWLCPEDPSEKDYKWDEGFRSDGSGFPNLTNVKVLRLISWYSCHMMQLWQQKIL